MQRRKSHGRPWTPPVGNPLYGFNAVHAALVAQRRVPRKLFLAQQQKADHDSQRHALIRSLIPPSCPVVVESYNDLTGRVKSIRHQGIVLECSPRTPDFTLTSCDGWEGIPLAKGKIYIAVINIEDDMTIGAVARAGEFFGVKGLLLLGSSYGALLTTAASRASAGALEYMDFIEVRYSAHKALTKLVTYGYSIVLAHQPQGNNGDKKPLLPLPSLSEGPPCILVVGSDYGGIPPSIAQIATNTVELPFSSQPYEVPHSALTSPPRMTPSTATALYLAAVTQCWARIHTIV